MDTQKKNLYQKLGSNLISKGKWFLNRATPMSKWIYNSKTFLNKIKDTTGITPALYDEKYHTTDIETWKKIIENDWTDRKKYITDTYDCDNHANSFCSYCADIYNLNSAGRFSVELLDVKTNKHIGWHRAVIIVDKNLDCWLLESQTDALVKIERGRLSIIDNWVYKPHFIGLN